jgi:hypothetical protein
MRGTQPLPIIDNETFEKEKTETAAPAGNAE